MPETIFKATNTEALLCHFHDREFSQTGDMLWPWVAWRDFIDDGHSYLKSIDVDAIPDNLGNLEIARNAVNLRLNHTVNDAIDKVRSFIESTDNALNTLSLSVQLELLFLCFSEKKWPLLEELAFNLLNVLQDTHFSNHHGEKCELIFEALCFSFFRRHSEDFITNGADTAASFKNLLVTSKADRLLASDSAARIFHDAQAKFSSGDIDGGTKGYRALSGFTGFKSPVFPQTHCLIDDLTGLINGADTLDEAYADYSTVTHHMSAKSRGTHTFLVSIDQGYLDRFGELYCAIAAKTSPGATIHFHCINPDDDAKTVRDFSTWQARYEVTINWSHEQNRMLLNPPPVPSFTEAIASCARYVYLPDYLAHYGSVTVTDIDGWPEAPMEALTDFTSTDIRVNSWIWRAGDGAWRTPWSNISAGLFSASSSGGAQKATKLISRYLKAVFVKNYRSGNYCFYADQAALFLCLKHAESMFNTKISFIEGSFKQSAQQHHLTRDDEKKKTMQDKLNALDI